MYGCFKVLFPDSGIGVIRGGFLLRVGHISLLLHMSNNFGLSPDHCEYYALEILDCLEEYKELILGFYLLGFSKQSTQLDTNSNTFLGNQLKISLLPLLPFECLHEF